LNASDGWVGTLTAVASLSAMVGYYAWQKGIARWGESRVLRSTIATGGIFPIAAALLPALTPILGAAAVDGLLMSGVNLSHFNILLKVCPRERRASYISLYTVIMNAGAFVAPLLGVALAGAIGLRNVLLIGGAIRTLGGLLFLVWPVRVPEPAPQGA
jgi:MFS family permease